MLFRTPFCLLTTKKGHFWRSAPLEKCILRAFLSHFCPIFEHFCLIFALFCLIFALFCPFLMLFYAILVLFSDHLGAFLCPNGTLSMREWWFLGWCEKSSFGAVIKFCCP